MRWTSNLLVFKWNFEIRAIKVEQVEIVDEMKETWNFLLGRKSFKIE